MADRAIQSVKRCHSAGVSWRLALTEFLSTPGPDGKSPTGLCGHQFKGILHVLNTKINEHDSDLFSERKESEKKKSDTKSKQLPVLCIGSYVSYLNTDLKSWSIGTIHARSHNDWSCQVLMETGNLISRNHVHLRPTSVQPIDRLTRQCNVNTMADKPFRMPSGEPAPNHDKVVSARNSCSTKNAAKTNDVPNRIRSGREVCKPPHYRD